jgi:two-component system, cell cycle sensor histidine kinase and response regulator CckA
MKFGKYFIATSLGVFLLFVAALYAVYTNVKEQMIQDINIRQTIHAQQAAAGIENYMKNTINTLNFLSRSPDIIDLNAAGRQVMMNCQHLSPDEIKGMTRINAQGKIIYTVPSVESIGKDISDQEHIRLSMKTHTVVVSDVFTAVQGFRTVAVHVPVLKNGTYDGTLAFLLSFDRIAQKYIETIRVGGSGYAWVVSEKGVVISSPVKEHIGKYVYDIYKDFPDIISMMKDMLKSKQGVTTYYYTRLQNRTAENVFNHAVFMSIDLNNTFWSIVVATPEDEVIASLAGVRIKLLLIMIALFTVYVICLYLIVRFQIIIGEQRKREVVLTALQEGERQISLMYDTIGDIIFMLDVEKEGEYRFASVNQMFLKTTGLPFEEIIGKSVREVIHEPSLRMVLGKYRQAIEEKTIVRWEETTDYPTGRLIGEVSIAPLFDKEGTCTNLVGAVHDITERKRAEEELRRNETLLRTAVENLPLIFYIIDPEGKFKLSIGAGLRGLMLEPNQVTGLSVFDVYKDYPEITASIKKSLAGDPADFESHIAESSFANFVTPFSNIDGTVAGIVGVALDITERKQAEEALRQKTALLEAQLNSSIDGILVVDKEGKKILQNRKTIELWKIPQHIADNDDDQLQIQHVMHMTVHPDPFVEKITHLYNHPDEISRDEVELTDGRVLSRYSAPVLSKDGHNYGRIWTFSDITERKRAEEKLSALTLRQQAILAAVPDIIMEVDNNKIYNWANKAGIDFFGNDVIGKEASYYFEGDQVTYNVVQPLFNGKDEIIYIESWQRRKDGEKRLLAWWCRVLKDKSGNVTGALSSARDITERQWAEEALVKEQFLMKMLMDNVPDHIYFKDKESRFTRMNKAHAERFGLSDPSDAVGKTDFDFFTKHHAQPAFDDEQKIIKTGLPLLGLEEKETWPDGRVTWVTTTKMPLRNTEGKIIGTFGISKDITQRKEAEETLRETRDYLENLFSFANAPILVWDPNLKITRFNLAIEKLTGYTVYDIVGKHVEMLFPAESRKSSLALIAPTTEGDHLITVELPLLCKNGSTRIVLWSTANIYAADGQTLVSTIAQGQDITEQKKLQQALLQSQKMESIGTLAGGIAHDFNNILGIILGYTSFMERETISPEKLHENLGIINNAVGRGAALVGQILTFARKKDIVFNPMSVPDLIHELLSMLRQTFPRVITFIEHVDKSIPLIHADRTQLHQVMLNLCLNARDAMPNGGTITIKAEKQVKSQVQVKMPDADQHAYICISVTDTGEGMNEATRRQIFDPFFTTKEQGKGTGLGLAVVYGAVQSHHGFIDVESETGRGTTFMLYFPVPPASEQSTDVSLSTESFSKGGSETILLIEDEEALLEIVRLMLETNGYTVLSARDGIEAANAYKQHQQEIDIVLTDMGLPGMTGMEVFKKLKEVDPQVKVIAASGFFEPDVKTKMDKDGAKGFIQKPYSPDEVLRILRKVLDEKKE